MHDKEEAQPKPPLSLERELRWLENISLAITQGETVQKPEVQGFVRRDEGVPGESRRHG